MWALINIGVYKKIEILYLTYKNAELIPPERERKREGGGGIYLWASVRMSERMCVFITSLYILHLKK